MVCPESSRVLLCVYLLALLGKLFPLGLSAENADQVVHALDRETLLLRVRPGEQAAYGYMHTGPHSSFRILTLEYHYQSGEQLWSRYVQKGVGCRA